jgi:hypothetical protein
MDEGVEQKGGQAPAVLYDPTDPDLLADPYPIYEQLRQQCPVGDAVLGRDGARVVSRFPDAAWVLGSPASRMRPPGGEVPEAIRGGPAARMWAHSISMSDPPDHTRLRRLLSPAFTPRATARYRPLVEQTVTEALDAVEPRGEMEVMAEFAMVVPMRVICRLLGIPDADWEMLMEWTPDFLRMFVPDANDEEGIELCHRACANFIEYLGALVDRHRESPTDNLTSHLVALEEAGDRLSRDELIATLRGLLTAGFETTMGLIGSMVLGLLQNPDQMAMLRSSPELIPNAVEEFLRWEAPLHAHYRYLTTQWEVDGERIESGERVLALIAAANRDPDLYEQPDRIDVQRPDIKHLSFGGGRHLCLGAPLARMEAQVAISELLRRFEPINLAAGEFRRRPHFQFRLLERLPVTFGVVSDGGDK